MSLNKETICPNCKRELNKNSFHNEFENLPNPRPSTGSNSAQLYQNVRPFPLQAEIPSRNQQVPLLSDNIITQTLQPISKNTTKEDIIYLLSIEGHLTRQVLSPAIQKCQLHLSQELLCGQQEAFEDGSGRLRIQVVLLPGVNFIENIGFLPRSSTRQVLFARLRQLFED